MTGASADDFHRPTTAASSQRLIALLVECLDWHDDLPHVDWPRLAAACEDDPSAGPGAQAWNLMLEAWLERLERALGWDDALHCSPHFLLLAPYPPAARAGWLRFSESCRRELLAMFDDLASFDERKLPVLVFPRRDDYYRFVTAYYPDEGEFGESAGMFLRLEQPLLAILAPDVDHFGRTLAHELTHAALSRLNLPLWLEEGFTQLFESTAVMAEAWRLDPQRAKEMRAFWRQRGLERFWSGEAFSAAGKWQPFAYELALVLTQLLIEEHQPAWFGFDRSPVLRLRAFLAEAKADDAGQAAAQRHLARSLRHIAGQFLGEGDWD